MKSKISFFNKTIFKKNVCLYWPIWAVYSFVLFCSMPFVLWLEYNDGFRLTPLTDVQKFSRLCDVLEMTPYYVNIIAFTAVITGMALFSYLYNSKSANMIHSLPVDRRELFGTNVISGLSFLAVPQVVVFIVTMLICISEKVAQVEYLGMWLLLMLATDVIAFSIVTCCAMFTGQLVALPIYVVVVNCLAYVVNFLLELVVTSFGYGVESENLIRQSLIIWLSPFACYKEKVQMIGEYKLIGEEGARQLAGMELLGLHCVVIYFLLAIVLYVIAYFVYQKRHIEHAGDLITVEFVKPIFRWGVATIAAVYGSALVKAIFGEFGMYVNLFVYILVLLFVGMVFYFFADMFVRKTFRVFKKKNWKECGLFLIALLLCFGALYGYTEIAENRVPKKEDIKYAFINMGYEVRCEGEEVSFVTDIHNEIVKDVDYYEKLDASNSYWIRNMEYEYISIRYVMEDGEAFSRYYKIPIIDKTEKIVDQIEKMERDPEVFLKNLFGSKYQERNEFKGGWIEFGYYINKPADAWDYITKDLDDAKAKLFYNAIIADAKAGNLIKYNTNHRKSDGSYDDNMAYRLGVYVIMPEGEDSYDYWEFYDKYISNNLVGEGYEKVDMEEMVSSERSICYGKDCVNIINALISCGYIESPDEICWD